MAAYHGTQERKWGSTAMDLAEEGYEVAKWCKVSPSVYNEMFQMTTPILSYIFICLP